MIQDYNKKAELFNDYFCKQANLNDSENSVPDITDILINGLEQITITENEVKDILKILDTSTAIGPDLIKPRLLKEAASMLKYPLCRLFNLSLTLSTFPSEWKYPNVTPVFKKDSLSKLLEPSTTVRHTFTYDPIGQYIGLYWQKMLYSQTEETHAVHD